MSEETVEFNRGDQIAYIPYHAYGDINHKDVEYGFVTSTRVMRDGSLGVWCRYFYKNGDRRTVANSQMVSSDRVVRHISRDQSIVDAWLKDIDAETNVNYLDMMP